MPRTNLLIALFVFTLAAPAFAHDDSPAVAPTEVVAEADQPVVAVVDAFGAALHANDMDKVAELLADDVLVLESGGAER